MKGKAVDSSPRRGATFSPSNVRTQREERKTSVRQEENLLTILRSSTLFLLFFLFSFCSPVLLSVHQNPSVHPSAGHFLRHAAGSILMLRDNIPGMERKHVVPPEKKRKKRKTRHGIRRAHSLDLSSTHRGYMLLAATSLSLSLTLSSPVILLKFSMYAPSPSNVPLPPSLLSCLPPSPSPHHFLTTRVECKTKLPGLELFLSFLPNWVFPFFIIMSLPASYVISFSPFLLSDIQTTSTSFIFFSPPLLSFFISCKDIKIHNLYNRVISHQIN